MDRRTLYKTLPATLCLSALLAACGGSGGSSRGDVDDSANASRSSQAETGNNNTSTTSTGNTGGTSVNGLWDFSSPSGTVYQHWTDEGIVTIYAYQGDAEEGTGENCYYIQELVYTVAGTAFSFIGGTFEVTRESDQRLRLNSSFGDYTVPLASGIDRRDLNGCNA